MRTRMIVAAVVAALPALALAQQSMQQHGMTGDESASIKAYMEAHRQIMSDMSVKMTGNADRDFAMMMIPHHQGAIDMVRAELQHGDNPELKRMAQKIIDDQRKEIAELKAWLAKHPQ
jgi:uncharacterized protein (DUF305 family)